MEEAVVSVDGKDAKAVSDYVIKVVNLTLGLNDLNRRMDYLESLLYEVRNRCVKEIQISVLNSKESTSTPFGLIPEHEVESGHRHLVRLEDESVSNRSKPMIKNSFLTVGRSSKADIKLDCPRVSRFHARFRTNSDSLFVSLCSVANRLSLNGKSLGRENLNDGFLLRHDDVVKIGNTSWKVRYCSETIAKDCHQLFEHDFHLTRKPGAKGKHRRNIFASVIPAARKEAVTRARPFSFMKSFYPVVRHRSTERLNARNRDMYKEQISHIAKGDDPIKRDLNNNESESLPMTRAEFTPPIANSSPICAKRPVVDIKPGFTVSEEEDSSSSGSDIIIESVTLE